MRILTLDILKHPNGLSIRVSLLLVCGLVILAMPNNYAYSSNVMLDDVNNSNRSIQSQFTANEEYVAFTTATGKNKYSILVYNTKNKNWFVIKSKKYGLFGPKFSYFDNETLYFSAATPDKWDGKAFKPAKKIRDTLFKCSVRKMKCLEVFQNTNAMQSPIELLSGDILLASGIPYYGADGFNPKKKFIKFGRNDFYLLTKDKKIKRLTHLEYSVLHSVDLNGEGLFFEASRPRIFLKERPLKEASQASNSRIYFVNYKSLISGAEPNRSFYKPISLVGKYAIRPSAHPKSNLLAFKSADYLGPDKFKNGWRYDLVIYDFSERRVVTAIKPKLPQSFSKPSVTSAGKIKFFEYINGIYRFYSYDVIEGKKTFVGRINFAEISAAKEAKVIQIK